MTEREKPPEAPSESAPDPVLESRRLIRAASSATLATQASGQPFASLVTPAAAPDLAPLLWLSTLSEHTRQLRADPRCALLFTGVPNGPNPQTTPRVTLTGEAKPVEGPELAGLKARWLARHPYAALYADFGDFALWRIAPGGALLVGGFARAVRLRIADLLPDATAVAAIAAAEAAIVEHVNAGHAETIGAIAQRLLGQEAAAGDGPWRMVAVDVDGADLTAGEQVCRLHFSRPVASAEDVRAELVEAARSAEAGPRT